MEPSTTVTFCCVQCRLLQSPATTCAECGAPTIAPVELVRELLYYRDMRFNNHRDWGMLTAFLAGSSLAMPILAPFAVVSTIALGVHKVRGLRSRNKIVGIEMQHLGAAAGSTTLFGVARRFRTTVSSLVDDAPVLLEHAVVRDRHGAVLLRRSVSTPFLIDTEELGPVLVTGVTRVTSSNILSERIRVRRGDPRLSRMGVPEDLPVSGDLEISSVLADAGLAVTGIVEDEAVAALAFHRDGGLIPVMRGRVGSPVLVEDRRLIAAALHP